MRAGDLGRLDYANLIESLMDMAERGRRELESTAFDVDLQE